MKGETRKYLLDSDTLIAMLRDVKGHTGLRQRALNVGLDKCYVSAISLAELSSGAYRMASERGLFEVEFAKSVFNILPFDCGKAPDFFGKAKALLCGSGTPLDDMDLLIAASAMAGGMTVVTHNIRHFARIPDLKVEDWLG